MADSDCRRCGACCHSREGTILVTAQDLAGWRARGRLDLLERLVEGHFGQMAFPHGPGGACIYLGRPGAPNECSIYEDRAAVCRSFPPGCGQCREARRDGRLG